MAPKTKTINIILMDGGVGDQIASLTAVDYILKRYTWLRPKIWVQDYLKEFALNVLPKDAYVKSYSEMQGLYKPDRPTKTTKWDGHTSPMKIHLVDYAFLRLCDELPSIEHKNYCKVNFTNMQRQYELPKDYIVLTTGYTADVREFPAKTINEVAQYLHGKGYATIFLGSTTTKTGASHVIKGAFKEEIDFNAGINLIDKTSLLEAAYIINNAKAVVGVDNGLLHLAGCTDVSIIAGYTTVSPDIRMPIRNNTLGFNVYPIVPDVSLDCRFCQQTTNFLYDHDYRNCWYKENKKRDSIYCVDQMTADKFITALEKVL